MKNTAVDGYAPYRLHFLHSTYHPFPTTMVMTLKEMVKGSVSGNQTKLVNLATHLLGKAAGFYR